MVKKNMAGEWIDEPEKSVGEIELEKQLGLEKQKVEAVQKQLEDTKKEAAKLQARLTKPQRKNHELTMTLAGVGTEHQQLI